MGQVARQPRFPIAHHAAGQHKAITPRLPLGNQAARLFSHMLARHGLQHLVQPIQQQQGPSTGERLLKQGGQPRQAAPMFIVDGEKVGQGQPGIVAAAIVIIGRQRHKDRQGLAQSAARSGQGQIVEQGAFARARVTQNHQTALGGVVDRRRNRLAFAPFDLLLPLLPRLAPPALQPQRVQVGNRFGALQLPRALHHKAPLVGAVGIGGLGHFGNGL